MDKLIAEKETKTEEKIEVDQQADQNVEKLQEEELEYKIEATISSENEKYLGSFKNMTVADFRRKEEEKSLKEFELEKEKLIEQQFEKEAVVEKEEKQEASQKIIEKPNYDLLQENNKVIKLLKKDKTKKTTSKKRLGLFLSLALGVSAIICISNIIAIDHMSSNLSSIEYEYYEVNLPKYLKNIADLDTTKKGMEFIETYPEDVLDAGQAGQKTNWFDKFCNFLSGLFGG